MLKESLPVPKEGKTVTNAKLICLLRGFREFVDPPDSIVRELIKRGKEIFLQQAENMATDKDSPGSG